MMRLMMHEEQMHMSDSDEESGEESGEESERVKQGRYSAVWLGEHFNQAVGDDVAPGYSEEVAVPIDLSLMLHRLKGLGDIGMEGNEGMEGMERMERMGGRCTHYGSYDSLRADFSLVEENCRGYNGEGSWLTGLAKRLQQLGGELMATHERQQQQMRELQGALAQDGGGVEGGEHAGTPSLTAHAQQ
jgi:hypothetical protein